MQKSFLDEFGEKKTKTADTSFKIFNFCVDFFGHVGNELHKKSKVNSKISDAINGETNNHNTHIAQYLKS